MRSAKLLMTVVLASFLPAVGRAEAQPMTETQACCGVTASDADLPIRPDAVESISPIYRNTRSGRHLQGVAIVYRSGLGLTSQRLQAALDCQIARNRVQPSAGSSPLAVSHVDARVRADGERIRADLTSDYVASAEETLLRSRKLFGVAIK